MTTSTLLTEFLIIGFIMSLAIVFAVMFLLGRYDFLFLRDLGEFSNLFAVGFYAISYLLGTLIYRAIRSFDDCILNILKKLPILKNLRILKKIPSNQAAIYKSYLCLLQIGSEKLVGAIEYEANLFRLFSTSTVVFFFLGCSFSIWVFAGFGIGLLVASAIVCAILTAAFFGVALRQGCIFADTVNSAAEIVNESHRNQQDRENL